MIAYTEEQLSPLFVPNELPVRVGWYLWLNSDDEYMQSKNAPQFEFKGTVWRYWNGSKWQWFGSAIFTSDGTDGKAMWRDAKMDQWTHWRGLAETFGFKIL